MPLFILLSTLTQQGVQTLKSNPERLRQVNHDVEELGCRVLHQWATLGEFDFVNVVEAPDIATVAKVSVALGARGSTRIETLPALEVEEFLAALEYADDTKIQLSPDAARGRTALVLRRRPSNRRVRQAARRAVSRGRSPAGRSSSAAIISAAR